MANLSSDLLLQTLRRNPRAGSKDLCSLLGGINRSTLTRNVIALGGQVIGLGSARRSRYALRQPLRGDLAELPLYRIDEHGNGHELGQLALTYPSGTACTFKTAFPWPLDADMADGWFEGVPYPLLDMRPQGFLGRNFAHRYGSDLGVSDDPQAWSDADVIHVLSQRGYDQPGDLILGEPAYRRFLMFRHQAEDRFLPDSQIEQTYRDRAADALSRGIAGSSAGGEFPKFMASRMLGGRKVDVIVKFSGEDDSPAVRRWSDLLICEHIALETLNEATDALNVQAAESAVYQYAGRTFLEVVRFDRQGDLGRLAVCTLASLNPALVGMVAPWPKIAHALHGAGWLSADAVERIALAWWFGKLIANSDMHEGNLAFRPGLILAPIYDMLPMHYAPLRGGEVPEQSYSPELPLPAETRIWHIAASLASRYWRRCAVDSRISPDFMRIAAENAKRLEKAVQDFR